MEYEDLQEHVSWMPLICIIGWFRMHYWLVRKRSGVVVYLSIIPDCKTFTYFGYITIIYIF